MSAKRVLHDCRWLGIGGAGRVTELLLAGLREIDPPGRWTLWGASRAAEEAWPGAEVIPTGTRPTSLAGQRELFRVPRNDVALYMHQIRPLRPGRSVTVILDTIPLHFGSGIQRASKRVFFLASARLSSRIVTISEHSRRTIVEDLRVPEDLVTVVDLPVDERFVATVEPMRARVAQQDFILYVGRFAAHKNLERLILAFGGTRARREGTELWLVGGDRNEIARLHELAQRHRIDGVRFSEPCSDERLAELYARARLLVMPSLEEGFGLPAWEAMSVGLPVSLSSGGALRELGAGWSEPFPPTSIPLMAEAIDEALRRGEPAPRPDPAKRTPAVLARQIVDVLELVMDE